MRITRCPTAVRRISAISTTSARQSATVCQCRRKHVTLASATRMGPGWGSMSPHLNKRRGGKAQHRGGGGCPFPGARAVGGGGSPPPPPAWVCPSMVTGCGEGGQWRSHACLQVNRRPKSCSARVRQSAPVPIQGRTRWAAEGAAPGVGHAAAGTRKGRRRTLRAAALPIAREAEGLPDDLVHAVLDRPWPGAAEGVRPQRRGVDLPWLRQDGPPHVADHGEEGVDGVGHLPPRQPGPRVGGRLAGGVVVVHPNCVVPAGRRRPLKEGEAAARAEEPKGGGGRPIAPRGGAGSAAATARPSPPATWGQGPCATCKGGGRCGDPAGGRARRTPGGTSTAGLGPQWPPWYRTPGHSGDRRR